MAKAKSKAKPEKLLRKDVLKLIDNLTSGEYVKGRGALVFSRKGQPDKFCCLGVWADQHGCVWEPDGDSSYSMTPVIQKRGKTVAANSNTASLRPGFTFGLNSEDQQKLASLNDSSESWKEVLHYIVDELLPRAE